MYITVGEVSGRWLALRRSGTRSDVAMQIVRLAVGSVTIPENIRFIVGELVSVSRPDLPSLWGMFVAAIILDVEIHIVIVEVVESNPFFFITCVVPIGIKVV